MLRLLWNQLIALLLKLAIIVTTCRVLVPFMVLIVDRLNEGLNSAFQVFIIYTTVVLITPPEVVCEYYCTNIQRFLESQDKLHR